MLFVYQMVELMVLVMMMMVVTLWIAGSVTCSDPSRLLLLSVFVCWNVDTCPPHSITTL